jgi:hypothetical protein
MARGDAAPDIIVVRSLVESDLGWFAAHRAAARSKQRALNVNAEIARRILSKEAFEAGGANLNCICACGDIVVRESRRLGKSGKNWRLGGHKIEGHAFAELDCKDLALIRTRAGNDGTQPVTIVFISKAGARVVHAGLAAILERQLAGSMAAFQEVDTQFEDLAMHCAAIPWESPGPSLPQSSSPGLGLQDFGAGISGRADR